MKNFGGAEVNASFGDFETLGMFEAEVWRLFGRACKNTCNMLAKQAFQPHFALKLPYNEMLIKTLDACFLLQMITI